MQYNSRLVTYRRRSRYKGCDIITVVELKQRINENNKIENVLVSLGCHNIKYHQSGSYWTCSNPDGDNVSAITVYCGENLTTIDYTRDISRYGNDLISLCQYNLKRSFMYTIRWLCDITGIDYEEYEYKKQIDKIHDPLYVFTKVKHYSGKFDVGEIMYLDEDESSDYVPYIPLSWFHEGIIKLTIDKFGLGYSYKRKRVIIPIKYWMNGKLVGYNTRTVLPNYEELGIRKYCLTTSYKKQNNLYGLRENLCCESSPIYRICS